MKTCTVYGLREVGTEDIRYVGQTSYALNNRLKRHWSEANNGNKTARSNWMRSVRDRGGEIESIPIEENAEWNKAEIRWIAEYRENGARLLNHTDGGQGTTPGTKFSQERIKNCKEAQRKNYRNPETIRKHHEAIMRHAQTPKGQANLAALQELVRSNPEYEKRRVDGVRKSHRTEEFRELMSEQAKEQMSDPAARAHLAKLNHERMKDPKNREMAAENARKGWQDPEKKAKRCQSLKEAAQRRWAKVRAEREANG